MRAGTRLITYPFGDVRRRHDDRRRVRLSVQKDGRATYTVEEDDMQVRVLLEVRRWRTSSRKVNPRETRHIRAPEGVTAPGAT